jgi:hypothetical protein
MAQFSARTAAASLSVLATKEGLCWAAFVQLAAVGRSGGWLVGCSIRHFSAHLKPIAELLFSEGFRRTNVFPVALRFSRDVKVKGIIGCPGLLL